MLMVVVGWQQRYVKRWWWMISRSGKRRAIGRPKIDASVKQIIVDIKKDNPNHGAKRFSATVSEQMSLAVSA